MSSMHRTSVAREMEFAKLEEAYRAAWRRFVEAVSCWQSLEEGAQGDNSDIHEAKIAAHVAHEDYRQARDALAQYALEHSPSGGLAGSWPRR